MFHETIPRRRGVGLATRKRHNQRDGAAMAYVPSGQFLMGSSQGVGRSDERPQRSVYLEAYWVYVHPVTVAQFLAYCRRAPRDPPPAPPWGWRDDHPVVNVTHEEARRYAEWAGGSLPSEAQWERAARGTDGRTYPWGEAWEPERCNGEEGGPGRTTPVDRHPGGASPVGCGNMVGNVWEWCADWYEAAYYLHGTTWNPRGPAAGRRRCVRGGGWRGGREEVRVARRGSSRPDLRRDDQGFRCVRGE